MKQRRFSLHFNHTQESHQISNAKLFFFPPEDEQRILIEKLRVHQLFSEPTLLPNISTYCSFISNDDTTNVRISGELFLEITTIWHLEVNVIISRQAEPFPSSRCSLSSQPPWSRTSLEWDGGSDKMVKCFSPRLCSKATMLQNENPPHVFFHRNISNVFSYDPSLDVSKDNLTQENDPKYRRYISHNAYSGVPFTSKLCFHRKTASSVGYRRRQLGANGSWDIYDLN